MNRLEFLGSLWSPWPSDGIGGGMNLVAAERSITARILSVCLVQKGEDFIHPDFGIAPDLFEPLSNYSPQYMVYKIGEELVRWVDGVARISIDVSKYRDYENQLQFQISFTPISAANSSILTWGYYEYRGAIWNQGLEPFLRGISLNGNPFLGF